MSFRFGVKSNKELEGVEEPIVRVVRLAILETPVDFAVYDGLRTLAEQRAYVESGASETMESLHLEGRAVDLVPYINGKLRWEFGPIFKVIRTIQRVARRESVSLVWGGVWDRRLEHLTTDLAREVELYTERRKAKGKRAFIDGPHIQAAYGN